jgi:CheY-like chemotaxis protein
MAREIRQDRKIPPLRLLMMSSIGDRADAGAAAKYFDAWLTKPVRQAQLYETLAEMMPVEQAQSPGPLAAQPADGEPTALATASPVAPSNGPGARPGAASGRRGLILVAEDNAVNQRLALHQLRKLGFEAEAVANGQEAVDALQRIPYQLVLMDCQMPVVDGYAATVQIRRLEAGERHTIIVAMTAHALEGDREKCLAAGMDDYLAKPVKAADLKAVLERWLPATLAAAPGDPPPAPGSDSHSISD